LIAETDEASPLKDKEGVDVQMLIEENESLRKGMHEILESIQNHDGKNPKIICISKYQFLISLQRSSP
jgi:hypothetical protein